jgi:hypothetical protein
MNLSIDLLDLRPPAERDPEGLRPVLKDALQRLSMAKGGFGELVTSHLKMIVAARISPERILHKQRTYVCRFEGDERRDGHYLACLLIWAAVSGRLARDQEAYRPTPNQSAISTAAQEAQLRFLKQFPDWEHWADLLDLPY